ncbi:N-acetyl-beta-glucosaminyl-glycoprotein 4-beta-N-acetylgalactosaminyltransferase 1 [Melanotaenia boesemani]|uniref:N-acetyl-beta-glucosaminyl-glycoprotein 4-beta-N-acetylgalactosaminyltransferase 1 n=1 Tax=Melanotaenia boesemani TaxID=1250792 RepID=UPI001C05C99D|nr:N-acetyl-beta-glucosaminyl-glycoprotein 4-beta-N-acetylgalactosaminyltransferase 1 [Melanotaenia boesemani]XP_041853919.1 N-acetyl-beta-glucosaminyl-glycoprotein 4-beta-N-acetylgalactosaminyltransferase 1 [Melanotaenia boesemani]
MLRFPVKKIRKQFKLLLLLVLLTSAVWFTYLHINQGKTIKLHFNYGKDGERQTEGTDASRKRDARSSAGHHKSEDTSDSREDEAADDEPITAGADGRDHTHVWKFLSQQHKKLPWKPEYKGQANLHVFEDWCGSSIAQLRKNLHFPLFPHTRITVKKLAVAPKWKNYGLRIFGFLHPYRDGDFQFSVSSDDNSEFWLSPDESPLNARLLVFVGQLGTEWTAPGEFSKFRSQSSKSVHLMSSRRYYFEILHKQDDKGSDHVEVGWRPFLPGLKYEVIDSAYISLYTDESNLKMNSVDHIPQTLASHIRLPESQPQGLGGNMELHGADMLKPDPRDTFYSTPMIDPLHLENVLPACLYSPTYVVKDFPIARYQGLQFVYLSFVYPNDFTRLTHMERENKCFYRESPIYLEKFGFYKYMKMDEEEDDRPFFFPNPDDFLEEEELVDTEDEAEIVGTQLPKRPSHPNQTSHTSTHPHQYQKTGSTPAGREVKEEEDNPNKEEEEAVNSVIHRRERRQFPERDRQMGRILEGDWGRDHTQGSVRQDTKGGLEDPMALQPDMDSVVRGRSLSWIHTDPANLDRIKTDGGAGGGEGARGVETQHKLSKSSLLFPQKSSLSALASRARQILSNSAHSNQPHNNSNKLPGYKKEKREENKIYITRPRPAKEREKEREQRRERREERAFRHPREVFPGVFLYQTGKTTRLVNLGAKGRGGGGVTGVRRLISAPQLWPNPPTKEGKAASHNGSINIHTETAQKSASKAAVANQLEKNKRKSESQDFRTTVMADLPSKGDLLIPPSYLQDPPPPLTTARLNYTENTIHSQLRVTSYLKTSEITESQQQPDPEPNPADLEQDTNRSNPDPDPDPEPEPEEGEMSDYSYEEVEVRPGWAEESINWQRTFSVNPMDFELLRSDWNDLRCNVSGNLQLAESEVVDVLAQYMEKLNERNGGIYTLLRIINVEKRRDSARGNRYLVELELMERGRSVVRLSEYIYLLLHRGRQGEESLENMDSAPASAPASPPSAATTSFTTPAPPPSTRSSVRPGATPWSTAYAKPLLCQPVMLQWRRDVMVHFVVPVKNQARWVQQFISDMENLHRQTKDDNFSIIIVDFESEDMDVEQALRDSSVPRYEYLRREGNFERSAGLQIGVDTIEDSHSIVFLCDLHIHFPLNILESIRKHCVEGRLAFAPIVMRLSCGSSPLEPDGYWEVNGFGLFGVYKSDFDKIGGMNTEEFKDRWGGEDWELLDRVLQNGLEVERLRLRNFFHYYHSKRGMWNAQNKKTPKG